MNTDEEKEREKEWERKIERENMFLCSSKKQVSEYVLYFNERE